MNSFAWKVESGKVCVNSFEEKFSNQDNMNASTQQPFLAIANFVVSSSSVFAIIFILAESTQFRNSQLTRSGGTLVATLAELTAERKPNKKEKSFANAKPFLF